jgi:GST-like protein
METKRQLDVLNNVLKNQAYIACEEYTIADIAIWAWHGQLALGRDYGTAKEFLNIDEEYPNVLCWAKKIAERKAVKRGVLVNRTYGEDGQLPNRHSSSDFDGIIGAKL